MSLMSDTVLQRVDIKSECIRFTFIKCLFACTPGGVGQSTELPLSQPPQPTPPSSATNTLRTNSCPGTPEMQRRREEAVKRLAAKV